MFNALGCDVSLNDLADRPPRGRQRRPSRSTSAATRILTIPTPHVPHGWEAQVMFDETTGTLFCGDLFTPGRRRPRPRPRRRPDRPAARRRGHVPAPPASPPDTAPTLRRLADLEPRTLALMHGPPSSGDCAGRRSSSWPTPTRPASAPRASRRRQREHHPDQRREGGDDAEDLTTTTSTDVRPIERPEATSAGRGRGRPHGVGAPVAGRRRLDPAHRLPATGTCGPWPATCSA